METFASVLETKGLIALIVGVLALIFLVNMIMGGGREREDGDEDDSNAEGTWADDDEDGESDDVDVLVATRAVIVPDPYGERRLYVELDDGEVVHLCGRWLDDYHVGRPDALFPCRRFRPYADFPDDPFDLEHPYRVECLGEPIEPLIAVEPLPDEARRVGLAAADWERLPIGFDRLIALIGPARYARSARSATDERMDALEQAYLGPPAPGAARRAVATEPPSPRSSSQPSGEEGDGQPSDPPPHEDDRSQALPSGAGDGPIYSTSGGLDPLDDLEPSDGTPPQDSQEMPSGQDG